jgi:glycerol-3-phosphate acyltransferase PlsY
MLAWLAILLGYMLGSVPTAIIAGHIVQGQDIRRLGDENSGAANVYRELGARAGIIVGVIDAAKGALAVLIARAFNLSPAMMMWVGVAAVIGHNFPAYLGFRGGRGVSTTLGVLLVLVTLPMLVLLPFTLLILILKRNVTPAMAFLFIVLPLVDWLFHVTPVLIFYGLALAVLIGLTTLLRTKTRALRQA